MHAGSPYYGICDRNASRHELVSAVENTRNFAPSSAGADTTAVDDVAAVDAQLRQARINRAIAGGLLANAIVLA